MWSLFKQDFKNRFIKHIEKIMITKKKNLHYYLIAYRFDYDKIEFRFSKKIVSYKRLRLHFMLGGFEFVIINYA